MYIMPFTLQAIQKDYFENKNFFFNYPQFINKFYDANKHNIINSLKNRAFYSLINKIKYYLSKAIATFCE